MFVLPSLLSCFLPRLQALCAKHNIPYRVCGLVEGTLEVLQCLKDVAMELQEGPVM